MAEITTGAYGLLRLGIGGKFAPFKTLRQVRDIRKARQELNGLERANVEEMVALKHHSMKEYIEGQKDGLKDAEEAVEHSYDAIKWRIFDLIIIKHIIREMYERDDELLKKGIPPKVGNDLKAGVEHTQQKINDMLRLISDMLGQLTRK